MIRSGVVDMLATNARNTFTHPPHIQEELKELTKVCSPEYLKAITYKNARELLINKESEEWK